MCVFAPSPSRASPLLREKLGPELTPSGDRPDRMFTSRSEYRVSLRADNADLRLTEKGRHVGVVRDARWQEFESTRRTIERGIEVLEDFRMAPEWWVSRGFEVRRDGNRRRYVVSPRLNEQDADFLEPRSRPSLTSQCVRPATLQGSHDRFAPRPCPVERVEARTWGARADRDRGQV